jgi:putative NADPH-quinone reductase
MARRILVINGHPDHRPERFCAALADAYADGARTGGHEVRRIYVGALRFGMLRDPRDFLEPAKDADIRKAQDDIAWAEHLVIVHPLWEGMAPALLKGFMEQAACGGFAFVGGGAGNPKRGLTGKSAHLIVTMGMPALAFRFVFGAFGVRAFARGILRLSGVRPVRKTYFGGVELSESRRSGWLKEMAALGRKGH